MACLERPWISTTEEHECTRMRKEGCSIAELLEPARSARVSATLQSPELKLFGSGATAFHRHYPCQSVFVRGGWPRSTSLRKT